MNRRPGMLVAALLIGCASMVRAQQPPAGPPTMMHDSPPGMMRRGMMRPGMMRGMMGPGMQRDTARMRELRQQVQNRFIQMAQTQLKLTDAQAQQLRTAMQSNQDRRRDIMRRQQELQRAIAGQMQPGIAANNDSLNRLIEQLTHTRVEMAQTNEQFTRDLSFLTPVQRARFLMMAARFTQRLTAMRGGPMMPMRDGPMGGPDSAGGPMPRRPWRGQQQEP